MVVTGSGDDGECSRKDVLFLDLGAGQVGVFTL